MSIIRAKELRFQSAELMKKVEENMRRSNQILEPLTTEKPIITKRLYGSDLRYTDLGPAGAIVPESSIGSKSK